MSFITTDYSKLESKGYDPLPTGEYEMIIKQASERATPSGAESLQVDLVVRNDVQAVPELAETNGKYSNRHVFMDNWKRKATHQYDMEGFMYILQAAGIAEGTPINSVNEFTDLLEGKAVRVYVKKEVDTYNTTDSNNPVYRNAVAPWNLSTTKFKDVNHQFLEKGSQNNQQQSQTQTQQQVPTYPSTDNDYLF